MSGSPRIRLVVNADAFGTSPEISRGILRAHREGIVTSTSLLGNCQDLAGWAAMLRAAPDLGVGIHLALTDGAPVSPPGSVPSLVEADGRFPGGWRAFLARWARGQIRVDEVERELDAQVGRACEAGLRPDHLDTHRSLGFLPVVGRAMESVARRRGIQGIRASADGPTLDWIADPRRGLEAAARSALAWLTRKQLGPLRHGPQSWGHAAAGELDEIRILEILGRLGPGDHELICHPSESDEIAPHDRRRPRHGAAELAALVSSTVRRAVERRGVTLCRWIDLF